MKGPQLHKHPKYKLLKQNDTVSFFHMQMPRWLFCDPKYAPLSLESKVAYTFLLNRFQLSKMNGWLNSDGEVFIIFPREKLAEEMGISYRKAIACFKELLSANLIWEHRLGRGNANHIYMAAVELSDENAAKHSSAPFSPRSAESAGLGVDSDSEEESPYPSSDAAEHKQEVPKPQVIKCENDSSGSAGMAYAEMPFLQPSNKEYIKKDKSNIEKVSQSSPACARGSMYNAQMPPTLFVIEAADISKIQDKIITFPSDKKYVVDSAEGTLNDATLDGELYGIPSCVQGMGLIYNKSFIEDLLGKPFDPSSMNTYAALQSIFEEISAKGISPVAISPMDWSLAAHYLNLTYSLHGPELDKQDAFVATLKDGSADLTQDAVFTGVMDTFDLLMEYNYYKSNPLETVADQIDKQAQLIGTRQVAFWYMGNWATTLIRLFDAEGDYGFIPVPISNDPSTFGNTQIAAVVPTYYCIDKTISTQEQRDAAEEFMEWMLYSDRGMDFFVIEAGFIPVHSNVTAEPVESLAKSIMEFQDNNKTIGFYPKLPSDHWSALGVSMQKYLAGEIDRKKLGEEIVTYWSSQN